MWSSSGTTEISIVQWDDIDDFDNYTISSIPNNPTFSCSVAVKYVDPSNGFHLSIDYPTSYKSVIVKVFLINNIYNGRFNDHKSWVLD